MNEVFLVGRLARDPEIYNEGTPRCKFTIAIDRDRYDGEDHGADFIRITTWSGLAEACNNHLAKGSLVAIKGKIRTDSFTGRDDEKIYVMEIIAHKVKFLSTKE